MIQSLANELCCMPRVADQVAANPSRRAYAAEKAVEVAVTLEAALETKAESGRKIRNVDATLIYTKALFDRYFQPGMPVGPAKIVERAVDCAEKVEAAVECACQNHANEVKRREEQEREQALSEAEKADREAQEYKQRAEAARLRAQGVQQAPSGNGEPNVGKPASGDEGASGEGGSEAKEAEITQEAFEAMDVKELTGIDNVTKNRLVVFELKTVGDLATFRQSREFTEINDITPNRAEKLDAVLADLKQRIEK